MPMIMIEVSAWEPSSLVGLVKMIFQLLSQCMALSHWGTYHSFNKILKIPSPEGRLLLEERHEADNEFPQVPVVKRFHIFERIPPVFSHLYLSGKVTNFSKRVWELLCLQLKGMEQRDIYRFLLRLSFHFLFCNKPFFSYNFTNLVACTWIWWNIFIWYNLNSYSSQQK